MQNCNDIYIKMYESCGNIIDKTFQSDNSASIHNAHSFTSDFYAIIQKLNNRKEKILLEESCRELHMAIFSVLLGKYRQAFMGLRFSLESALSAIKLSVNMIDFSKWANGNKDVTWASIIDKDNGIYSHDFVSTFFEGLTEQAQQIKGIAEILYRKCSEYIHGNKHTLNIPIIEYRESNLKQWCDYFEEIKYVILFSIIMRYGNEFSLNEKSSIEEIILDELASIEEIRMLFSSRR